MPYCPNCLFEYREGIAVCPDCGTALKPGPPPVSGSADLPRPETEPVVLCRISDSTEADIIRAALAEAGIPCALRAHGPIQSRLVVVTDGHAVDDYTAILVPGNRLQEARVVLEAVRSAPVEWPEGMEPGE